MCLSGLKRRLGSFLWTNIPCNLRGSDYLPGGVSDRGDTQGNMDVRAIFSATYGLEMLDTVSAHQTFNNSRLFIDPIRGHEKCYRLADGLRGRVAEQPLRAGIP